MYKVKTTQDFYQVHSDAENENDDSEIVSQLKLKFLKLLVEVKKKNDYFVSIASKLKSKQNYK